MKAALEGSHAVICIRVVEFLKTMSPASANALLGLMRCQTWEGVDADTKFVLLHEINRAITALRERSDLPPIDDPLPGAPENAFRIIKQELFPR